MQTSFRTPERFPWNYMMNRFTLSFFIQKNYLIFRKMDSEFITTYHKLSSSIGFQKQSINIIKEFIKQYISSKKNGLFHKKLKKKGSNIRINILGNYHFADMFK